MDFGIYECATAENSGRKGGAGRQEHLPQYFSVKVKGKVRRRFV